MEILIPVTLKSDKDGYDFLSVLAAQTIATTGQMINLDFSACTFFEGNLCAILGSILDGLVQRRNLINFLFMNSYLKGFMSRNKFLSEFNNIEEIPDTTNSTIHYRKFDISDEFTVKDYVENELLNKPGIPILSPMLKKEIIISISEIYSNAITHGNCDFVFGCGHSYSRRSTPEMNFTFVDLGKTIKNNVIEYLKKVLNGSEAIVWATSDSNSTKVDNHPGGLGLKIIKELIRLNKGKLQIVSANGLWEYENGHSKTFDLLADFPGTIVNIVFNLTDTKRYYLASELPLTENLF